MFSQGGEKLEFLNSCTHKYIYDEMKKQLEAADKSGKQMAVIDAPLLIEGNFIKLCQKVWAVYADDCVRAKRIMGRDSITYEQAMDRMKRQKPWEVYKKYADIIIDNSTDIESLKGQVEYNLNNPGENNGKKQV